MGADVPEVLGGGESRGTHARCEVSTTRVHTCFEDGSGRDLLESIAARVKSRRPVQRARDTGPGSDDDLLAAQRVKAAAGIMIRPSRRSPVTPHVRGVTTVTGEDCADLALVVDPCGGRTTADRPHTGVRPGGDGSPA